MILVVFLGTPIGQIATVAATLGTTSANGIHFPDKPPTTTEEVQQGATLLRLGNNDSRFVLQFAALYIENFNILAIRHIR